MNAKRRAFLRLVQAAAITGWLPEPLLAAAASAGLYELPRFGHVRLLHITDTHAQLLPTYFREPNVNIGVGAAAGRPPHLVGEALLKHFGIAPHAREAYALTYLDFSRAARRYGKTGGFAHLKTLVDRLRQQAGAENSLLLDGGDLWQGSATALWTRGGDMVQAANLLGVDFSTGHWEFTYTEEEIRHNIAAFKGEFLAQNVFLSDEAAFNGAEAYDPSSGRVFKPYSLRSVGGRRIAVIGQAFPYTPIANPARFIPDWRFGIHEQALQTLVEDLRKREKPDVVVLLSHNGMDVDLKLASRVSGIDLILGGHTHDAVPAPSVVENPGGKTLVTNAGCNGKFVAVVDLDVNNGRLAGYRYHLLPVFSDLLPADTAMRSLIERVRRPYATKLAEPLAVAGELLYRRGNFNGTMDQVICDALRQVLDAQLAFSPGFRWGTTVLPGMPITLEDVMTETAITYPETYVSEMTGAQIKSILEDVCDNLFNPDPYVQQGGDMVRVGGFNYTCDPAQTMGHRISDMRLDDGTPIQPGKKYKLAGWATVNRKAEGPPVWEVVTRYLRDHQHIRLQTFDTPALRGVAGNPGVADYRRI